MSHYLYCKSLVIFICSRSRKTAMKPFQINKLQPKVGKDILNDFYQTRYNSSNFIVYSMVTNRLCKTVKDDQNQVVNLFHLSSQSSLIQTSEFGCNSYSLPSVLSLSKPLATSSAWNISKKQYSNIRLADKKLMQTIEVLGLLFKQKECWKNKDPMISNSLKRQQLVENLSI